MKIERTTEEGYVAMDFALERILEKIAECGEIMPIHFVRVLRLIPGYDPKMAPGIENQWFGSDGFPVVDRPPLPAKSAAQDYPAPSPKRELGHASDCAVNSAPAYNPRECDCGAYK